MAKKANPRLIGAFVLGAVALLIIGTLSFGGMQYFAPKVPFVVYFPGASLSGLDAGSEVTFRGVKIGQVTKIVIKYDVSHQRIRVPIQFEMNPDRMQIITGENDPKKNIPELIARGLRGQLQTVSLVTGQTTIDFNFFPGTPVRLFGGTEPGVMELPTIPSDIEQLKANIANVLAKIDKLPLDRLTDDIIKTIGDADHLVNDADNLVNNANGRVQPLTATLINTSSEAGSLFREAKARLEMRPGEPLVTLNQTLNDARRLVNNVDASWPQISTAAVGALRGLSEALGRADNVLKTVQAVLTPSSPLYYEAVSTLREIRFTASAAKSLFEYLQRNPNSILTGNR